MNTILRTAQICITATCFGLVSLHSIAQSYPSRPVRVLVAYAPGGGADFVARSTSLKLQERLGQQFVVDNRGGASGIIGTDLAAKAPGDGYTLLLGQTGANALNVVLFKKLPYDQVTDFAPIMQVTTYPYIIALHPSIPAKNLQEFIALARSRPGDLKYGTPGPGSSAHLAVELFSRAANVKLTHVPYRGSGPAVMDTLAGQISLTFGDVAATTQFVVAGRLRAVAVTGAKRLPLLPNVATVQESGLPGFDASAWHGYFAPAGTPRETINKLYTELRAVLRSPDIQQRYAQDGLDIVASTPEEFSAYVKQEIQKWGKVVADAGITLE